MDLVNELVLTVEVDVHEAKTGLARLLDQALAALPPLHRDPFGRVLVAQAGADGMPILGAETKIPRYGVPVLPEKPD